MRRPTMFAVLLLLIVGCGSTPTDPSNLADWRSLGFQIDIAEITLSDGTRCVVIDDNKDADIVCDWRER